MTTEIWPYPSVSALSVADVILWARRVFGLPTTNLDLNKLVYLCHGWTLGVHGKPLIADRVEAWRYGPVIPAIYHEYKLFGSDNIDIEVEEPGDLGSLFVSWIRGGVESYKEWSTAELVSLTHQGWVSVGHRDQEVPKRIRDSSLSRADPGRHHQGILRQPGWIAVGTLCRMGQKTQESSPVRIGSTSVTNLKGLAGQRSNLVPPEMNK